MYSNEKVLRVIFCIKIHFFWRILYGSNAKFKNFDTPKWGKI